MSTLTLPMKGAYFDQIKAGSKPFEYRLRTPYWDKRMAKAPFRRLVLTRGYPKAGDAERRMVLPWRGYVFDTLTHEHFGPYPVEVYCIIVGEIGDQEGPIA